MVYARHVILWERAYQLKNAKTIQIFLPDSNPRGIRIAEITSRTVQVCLIPRANLDLALKRKELTTPSLYILLGSHEDDGKPTAYIGETGDFITRIKNHEHQKREWTHVVVVTSKTGFLTKTHVSFLESVSIEAALKANRFKLGNVQGSNKPHVRESDEADIWDFFDTAKLLIATLGYPIFDEVTKKTQKRNLLYCKGKQASAIGEYSEDGLVILKGSTCNRELVKSAANRIISVRNKLLEQGVLVVENDILRFTENFPFSSPSSAAYIVLGRSSNGWKEWKYKNGKTLDEVKRRE